MRYHGFFYVFLPKRRINEKAMIENQIEFNKVKEIWAGFAITKEAKNRIKEKWIILDESTLRAELKNTSDAKEMIEKLGNPPLQAL